jgi:alpha-tubulin suppressor-like RCC1 family protein
MLGDGTTVSRASPAPVVGISDALGVTVGAQHVCAWLKDGSARCWGSNTSNQLGAGLPMQDISVMPVRVQGLTGVVAMGAGCSHTCAVVKDGSVWCWGEKLPAGQLGVGSNDTVTVPTRVRL